MSESTVLVVEDDAKVRSLLRKVLEDEGFAVLEAGTTAEVLDLIRTTVVNLITLDINLGSDNGIELARTVRRVSSVPIIIVSGKDDLIDRVVGLEVGADDYITKPFHVREVIARIRSVLRRVGQNDLTGGGQMAQPDPTGDAACEKFHFDGMIAIPDRLQFLDRGGLDRDLTSGDFKLLTVFLKRPKRVLSRDQLMNLTGGHDWSPLDRTIDNQIARLRKKIERNPSEPKLIKTVRGVGYTFACDVKTVQTPDPSVNSA
ncbi:response regulator transcription factor [Roseobacter sp. YSTF-M11]|uniref:Response regulator transcription factor n=1 Tax=Roseobacter insulae TaxID=2859783 RepID=A0A9X1FRJ0_9RHOB|nr:response regulator transcription factor [Roseobacter insulae]MBW4706293.1 response regulator transcription factor [Roseobacter insulae]